MSLIVGKLLVVIEVDGATYLMVTDANFDAYDCGDLVRINMYLKLQKDTVMANS